MSSSRPRAIKVTVYGHLCAWRLHTGDRVTIDPDAPIVDGNHGTLVLAVLNEGSDFPLASLTVYFKHGNEEFLDVERAVWADGPRHGHIDRVCVTEGYMQLTGNGKDRGGACNGDSGGPVFHGGYGSNTIVAISGFVLTADKVCTGNLHYYRTDRQPIIDWIRQTAPEAQAGLIRIVQP